MKTKILLILVLLCTVFASCKKDDEAKFDYPLETLYGTWLGTHVQMDGSWIDITRYPYTGLGFSIKLNSDGSYYGSGYFGDGGGTYKAIGKTITTYIDGEVYATYAIKSLTTDQVEATMTMDGESMNIKAKRK